MKKTFLRSAAMIGFMALWSAGSMRADLIPFLCGDDPVGTACGATPGVIELGPNDYQYNYTVELTAGEFTQTSNDVATQTYVTIYDIPGYIAGTATAGTAPFSTSVQAMGITPSSPMAGCCTPIDTSLPNVTWTATTDVDARNTPIFYTGFSFQSTMGPKLVEGVYNDQAGKIIRRTQEPRRLTTTPDRFGSPAAALSLSRPV